MSWNFSHYVSVDAIAFYDPEKDNYLTVHDGGTATVILPGVKAGIRRDHLGYFVAVRPGLIQFSRANQLDIPPKAYWRKTTDFAVDTGGIIEVYPSRHTILRAEAGNNFIDYQPADLVVEPVGNFPGGDVHYPRRGRSSVLVLFGAGLRF